MTRIKSEPEIQHVLAHFALAILALTKGNRCEAIYELNSVDGLVFFREGEVMRMAKKGKKKRCRC